MAKSIDTVECICKSGYLGSNCAIRDLSICNNVTCSGHGSCTPDDNGSFKCLCDIGYSGFYCNDTILTPTDCSCQNGGTCVPTSITTQSCLCPSGFIGQFCEIRNNLVCQNVTCSGHGTCSPDNNAGFKCLCDCMN